MAASETSTLLGGSHDHTSEIESTSLRGRLNSWQLKALVAMFGCVAVLALTSANKSSFTLGTNLDLLNSKNDPLLPVAFDKIYHDWETSLYKQQANLLPLEAKSKHHEDVSADDDDEVGELIYLNHTKAFDLFKSTKPSLTRDFFYYQQGWDAQINQAYCGVASSMAVMNSLRGKIDLPQDPIYIPFPWATQMTLIKNECVRANIYDIDKLEKQFWGIGLDMATSLLNCHLNPQGFTATAHHVDPDSTVSVKNIRKVFIEALKDEDTRLVINYDRGGITQGPMGHGHFSPIGAYSFEKDAFLVMDVAKYKYPPVWVPTEKLMGGIGSLDLCSLFTYPDHLIASFHDADFEKQIGCQPMYRGYILITRTGNTDEH